MRKTRNATDTGCDERTGEDMNIIELHDVEVHFHEHGADVPAVRGVSLSIRQGEVFGIVGLSGAGKSTLVRTINLLERPTGGRVVVEGNDITDARGSRLRAIRQSIGMVFQGFNLVGNVTVGANVRFALRAGGWSRGDWDRRTLELLRLVGLEGKADSYPSALSGGQQQRVAIARALANNPRILLCDEATSALDVETTQGILDLLKTINRRLHVTIVFITHQLDIAKRIFDRVAVMQDGRIIEHGSTFDVFGSPRHATTRSLMSAYLGVSIPRELSRSLPAGTLVRLKYRGDAALEPLITDVARRFDVSISVLHANIEYFGPRPVGVLIVLVDGREPNLGEALDRLRSHVLDYRVLSRDAVSGGGDERAQGGQTQNDRMSDGAVQADGRVQTDGTVQTDGKERGR
jgi:D-methionine transport system ATP-binding protein